MRIDSISSMQTAAFNTRRIQKANKRLKNFRTGTGWITGTQHLEDNDQGIKNKNTPWLASTEQSTDKNKPPEKQDQQQETPSTPPREEKPLDHTNALYNRKRLPPHQNCFTIQQKSSTINTKAQHTKNWKDPNNHSLPKFSKLHPRQVSQGCHSPRTNLHQSHYKSFHLKFIWSYNPRITQIIRRPYLHNLHFIRHGFN
jgi:hypothetical protein